MTEKDTYGSSKAVLIYSGRNEFQVFLMLLCIISGTLLLLNGPQNDPNSASLPGWIQAAWGFGLVISALLNLFANFFPWRDIKNGLTLEFMSCVSLVLIPLFYTLALLGYVNDIDASQFLALDLLALVALVRAVRLFGYIRQINNLRRIEGEIKDINIAYGREDE